MAKGMPKTLREVLRENVSACYFCGSRFIDRRFSKEISAKKKRRMRVISPLILRKWTGTTVTHECMYCKMRFSFTWTSFFHGYQFANMTANQKENMALIGLINTYKSFLNKLKAAEKRQRDAERARKPPPSRLW